MKLTSDFQLRLRLRSTSRRRGATDVRCRIISKRLINRKRAVPVLHTARVCRWRNRSAIFEPRDFGLGRALVLALESEAEISNWRSKYLEGLKHNYIRRQHLPLSFGDLSVLKTNHPVGNWWSVQLSIEFQLSKNLLQIERTKFAKFAESYLRKNGTCTVTSTCTQLVLCTCIVLLLRLITKQKINYGHTGARTQDIRVISTTL